MALDTRIVASARPGIVSRVVAEEFRRDLYAQLSVLLVRVPALRDYAEDVPELLRHYVDTLTESEGLRFRRFSVAAQNRLRNYPWPDNVRELRNLTRRFLLNAGSEEIGLEEVERELSAQTPADEPLVKHDLLALPLREAREHFERAYLQQQLCSATARSACWPSASIWNAPTCIANCARWASRSGMASRSEAGTPCC